MQELSLWAVGEGESIFIYYVTGSLALSFFITIVITRSLRRNQPRVVELVHDDFQTEPLMTYLLAVTTSSSKGSGCPQEGKVFFQLQGLYQNSQFFQLTTGHVSISVLQRGSTDIFMCKLPETMGRLKRVKLVVAGLEQKLSWRVDHVKMYQPSSGARYDLPFDLVMAEVLVPNMGSNVAKINHSLFQQLCRYHHWTSAVYNTVRFGAYTEVVHTLLLFVSIFSQLCLTLVFYVLVSKNSEPDTFNIDLMYLFMAGTSSSFVSTALVLALEVLVRKVKSRETNPGTAYEKIMTERRITSDAEVEAKILEDLDEPQFTCDGKNLFILTNQGSLSDQHLHILQSSTSVHGNMPVYLRDLILALQETYHSKKLCMSHPDISQLIGKSSDIDINLHGHNLEDIMLSVDECSLPSLSKFCLKKVLSRQLSRESTALSNVSLTHRGQLWKTGQLSQTGPLSPRWSAVSTPGASFLDMLVSDHDIDLFKSALAIQFYAANEKAFGSPPPKNLQQWQQLQKKWARDFFQELVNTVSIFREELMQGSDSIQKLVPEMINWLENVCHRITLAATLLRPNIEEEMVEYPEIVQLCGHMTMEVVVEGVEAVYRTLSHHDVISVGDIVMMSHRIISHIQEAAHCLAYSSGEHKWDWHHLILMRSLNMNEEFKYMAGVLLSRCFQLSVRFDDNTWAYFKTLLRQLAPSDPYFPIPQLLTYVNQQLEQESLLDVIVRRLYHLVTKDAKEEVWQELTDQQHILTEMLIRKQVLNTLHQDAEDALRRKHELDKKFDLIPGKPLSRLRQLMAKRHVNESKTGRNEKKKVKLPLREEERLAAEDESNMLIVHSEIVRAISEKVKKRWLKQGLRTDLKAEKLVVKSFLHPKVIHADDNQTDKQGFMFHNFLHLKRTERRVSVTLIDWVQEIAQYVVSEVITDHSLGTKTLDDPALETVVEDVIIKTDFLVHLIRDDLNELLDAAVMGELETEVSVETQPSDVNTSAIPMDNAQATIQDHAMCSTVSVINEVTADDQHHIAEERLTEKNIVTEIKNELMPLKIQLQKAKQHERFLDRMCQLGYLELQTAKRACLCNIYVNNVIDAQYARDEQDDSHILTQAGLYQLEHDMMLMSHQPLPGTLITVVICFSILLILWSLIYCTLIGTQLTTAQNQEWICYFLLSIGISCLILETLNAYLLSLIL